MGDPDLVEDLLPETRIRIRHGLPGFEGSIKEVAPGLTVAVTRANGPSPRLVRCRAVSSPTAIPQA